MSILGSIYFNNIATSDNSIRQYVYNPTPNSNLTLTGAFTMEWWIYSPPNVQPGAYPVMISNNMSWSSGCYEICLSHNGNSGTFYVATNSEGEHDTGVNIMNSTWNNLAITRNSSNLVNLYINGVSYHSYTSTNVWDFKSIALGTNPGDGNGSINLVGYMSNLRILNGTCLYNSNYTVPTAVYSNIPNTVLLMNTFYNSPLLDSSPSNITMEYSLSPPSRSNTIVPSLTGASLANPNFVPCFKEGTKILCLIDDVEVYVPIQNIKRGFLVKTFSSGYKPVYMIGHKKIYNPDDELRAKHRLYKCTKNVYPTLFEDLVLTGCHSILVDRLTPEQEEYTREDVGKLYITESKYRLFTYLDHRANTYEVEGIHEIWHLALENDDYYMNYGIWANGLLVETTSKSFMERYSGMTLL
jgi:hypothetical protein